jgi:hypothetical protein
MEAALNNQPPKTTLKCTLSKINKSCRMALLPIHNNLKTTVKLHKTTVKLHKTMVNPMQTLKEKMT